ncbi:hypothetical protein GIB67_032386, partial [Kingdonia uniflora]
MGLRDIEATLPPGFRFRPSDEELVCHYLYNKVANEELWKSMVEVNLHICEPWQLPDVAKLGANEWYFFSFRDRKYASGLRTNRATTTGYWKATGKDRPVLNSPTNGVVGMRKTLVFYTGRAPNGVKTGWVMHEFRMESLYMPPKEDWVICRVSQKTKADDLTNKPLQEHELDTTTDFCFSKLSSSPPLEQTMPSTNKHLTSSFQQVPQMNEDNQLSRMLNVASIHPNCFSEFPGD